jgi:MFS family permease
MQLSERFSIQLVTANFLVKFTTWINFILLLIFIQIHYQTTLGIAVAIVAKRLPTAIFAYIAGKTSDRLSSRTTLLIAMTSMLLITTVLYLANLESPSTIYVIILSYVLISSAEGFYKPAIQGLLTQIQTNQSLLLKTNVALNVTSMLAIILSGLVSAAFFVQDTVQSIIGMSLLIYFIAILLIILIHPLQALQIVKTKYKSHPIGAKPLLRFFFVCCSYAFIGLVATKYPFEVYFNGTTGAGLIYFTLGLGVALSGLIYSFICNKYNLMSKDKRKFEKIIIFLLGFSLLFFTKTMNFNLALVYLLLFVCFYGLNKIQIENDILFRVPAQFVTGAFSMLAVYEEIFISVCVLLVALLSIKWPLYQVGIVQASVLLLCIWSIYFYKIQTRFFSYRRKQKYKKVENYEIPSLNQPSKLS